MGDRREPTAPKDPSSDIFRMERPAVAVDVVLLTVLEGELQIALIKREDDPYYGKHALPGRFVRYDEPIETTARRALETKGNITTDGIYLEQLYTFGQNLVRDTRIRTISVVYCALLPSGIISGQQGHTFSWFPIGRLPPLAFDHRDIVHAAVERIRTKLLTSDIIFHLLPEEFTLSELQRACETILGRALDKRNFRKKAADVYDLQDLKLSRREGAHRPARLYRFVRLRDLTRA